MVHRGLNAGAVTNKSHSPVVFLSVIRNLSPTSACITKTASIHFLETVPAPELNKLLTTDTWLEELCERRGFTHNSKAFVLLLKHVTLFGFSSGALLCPRSYNLSCVLINPISVSCKVVMTQIRMSKILNYGWVKIPITSKIHPCHYDFSSVLPVGHFSA